MGGRVLVLCGALAIASGALFRLSESLGIPALRMVGFWALVAVGAVAAREAGRRQAAAARGEVEAAARAVADRWGAEAVPLSLPGIRLGEGLALVFPGRVIVLWLDAMANYGSGLLAARRLEAGRRRAEAAAAAVAGAVADLGVPVTGCLVLLRRRAPAGGEADDPPVVNPEGLPRLLDGWAAGSAPAGRGAGEVAAVLRQRLGLAHGPASRAAKVN